MRSIYGIAIVRNVHSESEVPDDEQPQRLGRRIVFGSCFGFGAALASAEGLVVNHTAPRFSDPYESVVDMYNLLPHNVAHGAALCVRKLRSSGTLSPMGEHSGR